MSAKRSSNQMDEIGKWSEDKLKLLEKYLNAYTTIMKGQKWCKNGYHYIDAFAGTGKPKAKDEERYIDGSPIVALKIKHPFKSYIFIEKENWRIAKLEKLKTEFADIDIKIKQGDCNKIIIKEIVPAIRYENFNRGIIFLDPFGMDIEWPTVESITKTKALEIFLNFPVMAINRSVLRKNPYKLTEEEVERMNRFWGSTDWRTNIYKEVPNLFGIHIEKVPQTGKSLGSLFQKRLEQVFPEVTFPLVMKNSKGAPLYCLIFAGHNPTGKKIAQDIFKSFEIL
ncbi:MAG: three-Cys-motif partner protein TcmP [Candidatus Omnitrophica bacterium]|nr:three-Cys-motif partner protein TcmP [Candidatus Omnitrophota bacterium]